MDFLRANHYGEAINFQKLRGNCDVKMLSILAVSSPPEKKKTLTYEPQYLRDFERIHVLHILKEIAPFMLFS